jgi:soluble lytic murein transglycosylase-like protein
VGKNNNLGARIWGFGRAIAGGALCLGLLVHAQAADVFVSAMPDGSARYSTQALDASYRLIYRETQASQPIAPVRTPRSGDRREPLRPIIEHVAHRHGISPALVEAVMAVESNLDPSAISAKGAQGAMQLMPATAARYGLSDPPAWRDPERNIDAGVRHLKDLLSRYRGNLGLALAAYNSGSGAVTRHRDRIPPYRETMLYVPAVLARTAALTP